MRGFSLSCTYGLTPHKLVHILNQQKIDLHQSYPCPCCRGQINPIILTEAFGCDRCQKIFTLQDNGYIIEQVSNPHPQRNSWQWDGKRWSSGDSASNILSGWTLMAAVTVTIVFAVCSWQTLLPNKPATPQQTSQSP
jgi:hypothetical protein